MAEDSSDSVGEMTNPGRIPAPEGRPPVSETLNPDRGVRLVASEPPLAVDPERDRVANELHARPFHPIVPPKRFFHLAYLTNPQEARADRARITAFSRSHGAREPEPDDKHHAIDLGQVRLRWEQHAEFTTYSWRSSDKAIPPFGNPVLAEAPVKDMPPAPGPVMVAVHLALVTPEDAPPYDSVFDLASLCVASVHDGGGLIATDFRQDAYGFTRIMIVDNGMRPERTGSLVQRVLEIETYRTLALMGLPEVEKLRPTVQAIETELAGFSLSESGTSSLETNRERLARLIELASEVERLSARADYRFAATRAYDSIVDQRLLSIRESHHEDYPRWSSFLARRMKPAIATCETMGRRLAGLSTKLTNAADLLRTRVEIDMQEQNRDLLTSMNRRARLQLRLQQTVEGLSVAAVSYYVVGLIGYVLKGAADSGVPIDPGLGTALAVPVVIVAIWMTVRRIRRYHNDSDRSGGKSG